MGDRAVPVPTCPPSAPAVAPLENEPANEPAQDADAAPAATGAWVEADDGGCPATHPVKGKLSSGIFHVPGGQNYERTRADRCYVDPEAAAADGLRQSQR